MRNRAGNNIHFLVNYSREAMDGVSETLGTALLSGETVYVGQPLRLRAWEVTIIES